MNVKKYIILISACVCIFYFTDVCWAVSVNFTGKAKNDISDVLIENLKKKENEYIAQKKKLTKKILSLQKSEGQIDKFLKNKKHSEKDLKEQALKKEDIDKQINALVVSIVDIQNKIDTADLQIKDLQKRKETIAFAVAQGAPKALSKKEVPKAPSKKEVPKAPNKKEAPKAPGKKTEHKQQAAVQPSSDQKIDVVKKDTVNEPDSSVETVGENKEYKIAANDELQINVYGEPDLAKTVRVTSDGSISYPLLGRVNVDGLTTQGLEDKLARLLREGGFIITPQVSVFMEKFSTVSILGEVRNPGSYELKGKVGILDAIAQAGGFNIDADINNIKILRVENGEKKTMELRLGDIKKGLGAAEMGLKPNDTIFVEKIGKVTVLGEVARPGTFELKDKTTLLEAIAMAGGFTQIAAVNGTRVIREGIGNKKNVARVNITDITYRGKINKDIELLPGDIVYVPQTLF